MAMCLVGFWVKPPDTAVATLDVVNSEPVTPSQPPTEVTATCKSRSLIHAIVRWVIIGGATTVVTVLAIFAPGIIEQLKKSHSGSTSGSNSSSSDYPHTARSSHKSDRTLIRDYAECHYTHIRSIDIDSFTDGSYQVKIIMDSGPGYWGYKANTYTAKVDESAQQVTSWQLTASD